MGLCLGFNVERLGFRFVFSGWGLRVEGTSVRTVLYNVALNRKSLIPSSFSASSYSWFGSCLFLGVPFIRLEVTTCQRFLGSWVV